MIKNKNILITGGAGFIGSHLFEKLLVNRNYVVIIDNFNERYYKGKEEYIEEVRMSNVDFKDFQIINSDLLDNSTYEKIEPEIDIIFHLAAHAGVRFSVQNKIEVMRNNILGIVKILDYAVTKNVKKVVNASSSSVYGNPIYTPVDEEHPKTPISPYAISKLSSEIYADYYFREYDLPITSLRFYTVYGPRGRPDMAIAKFFNLIRHNKELVIYGDGEQLRDFTYVSDIIQGLILSAEKNNSSGEAFNLGYSKPINVNELINKMYNVTNKPKKVVYTEKQKGDVDITHSNIDKAKKLLGFSPQVNIDEGLQRTYSWLINKEKV
ncbi:MAG: DUF4292 domain-containing protein [Candidatus Lokiarchaeota archaeon]|nr:DUF4292 domain-containing protein [Candidatus Lokiarchaeota archaeon]